MQDPLQQLPASILLQIMKLIADLPTLYQLLLASSVAAGTFNECSHEIFDNVLRKAPRELVLMVRAVSIVSNKLILNPKSWPVCPAVSTPIRNQHEIDDCVVFPLPRELPLSSVQDMLRLSCWIHQLAFSCLNTHIDRTNSIKPWEMVEQSAYWDISKKIFEDWPKNYPPVRRYYPRHTGPPSWVEEYRVLRALWHIRFFHMIQSTSNLENTAKNSEVSSSRITRDTKEGLWRPIEYEPAHWDKDYPVDEIQFVQDYLEEINISLGNRVPLALFTPNAKLISFSKCAALTKLAFPPTDEDAKVLQQGQIASLSMGYGFHYFRTMRRVRISALKRSEWLLFRRLGFGIWDDKRLAELGLKDWPSASLQPGGFVDRHQLHGVKRHGMHEYSFEWRSLEGMPEQISDICYGVNCTWRCTAKFHPSRARP